jgi:hypothetical protein
MKEWLGRMREVRNRKSLNSSRRRGPDVGREAPGCLGGIWDPYRVMKVKGSHQRET